MCEVHLGEGVRAREGCVRTTGMGGERVDRRDCLPFHFCVQVCDVGVRGRRALHVTDERSCRHAGAAGMAGQQGCGLQALFGRGLCGSGQPCLLQGSFRLALVLRVRGAFERADSRCDVARTTRRCCSGTPRCSRAPHRPAVLVLCMPSVSCAMLVKSSQRVCDALTSVQLRSGSRCFLLPGQPRRDAGCRQVRLSASASSSSS